MPETGHECDDLVLRFLLQLRITDDSTSPNIYTLQFKLWFDERENHTAWSYQVECVRQDQSQRNERDIDHTKIDKFWNVLSREKARVQFFQDNHTRIVPKFPIQLAMANIDSVNFGTATL